MPRERRPDPIPDPDCAHFWKISAPNGPTSRARCQRCGGVELMANSFEAAGNRGGFNGKDQASAAASQKRSIAAVAHTNRLTGWQREQARKRFGFARRGG